MDAVRERWGWVMARLRALDLSENTILLSFAVAIGIISALGVVGFYSLIDVAFQLFFRLPAEHLSRGVFLAWRPVVTACGFALAWWVMQRIGRGHEGMNVPDVQLALARRGGVIPLRPALARTLASAITLGSGGSAGSEGPVAVLGSTVGSWLGGLFRFDASRVKVLVAAGAAGGISAAFNAPLAGAFFALEEIVGSLGAAAFPAVVVSSVVASVVSRMAFGNHPAFPVPQEYGYALTREIVLFYPLLGVVTGVVAALYVRSYFGTGALVARLRIPPALLPWVGGALVGALVYASAGTLVGYGHLAVRLDVFGRMPFLVLVFLVVGKIVATSITLNTGGSGGVFTPSLYLGAATGGAVGVALASLFPALALHPESYALVGMGAVVAAATGAPITGILIVFEMTNDYAIMLPLMLTTVIAVLCARGLERDTLYSGWLRRRGERLEQGADRDVLALNTVRDAFDPAPHVVPEGATVSELLEHLSHANASELPVVTPEGDYVGMLTMADLGRVAARSAQLTSLVVAADLAIETQTVQLEDSLLLAIRRMGARGSAALPVVGPEGRLLGIVTRAHVLGVYERALAERAHAAH